MKSFILISAIVLFVSSHPLSKIFNAISVKCTAAAAHQTKEILTRITGIKYFTLFFSPIRKFRYTFIKWRKKNTTKIERENNEKMDQSLPWNSCCLSNFN